MPRSCWRASGRRRPCRFSKAPSEVKKRARDADRYKGETPVNSPTRLDDLYRAYREARHRGEMPSPEEFCRDAPELMDGLRRLIAEAGAPESFPPTKSVLPPSDGAGTTPEAPRLAGPNPGAEPVPGYLLERRLGRGGFGEVWQASAPGGFRVAFKF